jgi:isoleucyl-tRNA synthetase
LEAKIHLSAGGDLYDLLRLHSGELPALFIVSQVELASSEAEGIGVRVERASGTKCERCWKYSAEVGEQADLPTVCPACAEAVVEILKD